MAEKDIKNLEKLSTTEDFISFYFNQLQTQFNSANINLSKAGFIGFFLNLLGNLQFDIKTYFDSLFNESFPVTAIDNDNLVYHSNLFGFLPGFATAAILNGNIKFDFSQLPVIPSNVNRREIFLNNVTFIADDILFTLESSYKIIITRAASSFNYQVQITNKLNEQTLIAFDINNPVVQLNGAVQFEKETISFTTPNYVFGSHFSQEFDLKDSFLSNITSDVDGDTFDIQLTKSFVKPASKTIFLKFLSDTKILIEVGSGVHGKYIPNKTINLVLFKSKGVKGNIAIQDITSSKGSLNVLDFDINDILLTNTVFTDTSKFLTFKIINGENGKDILKGELLREKLLEFIQSRTNLISETDFKNILLKFFNQFQLLFKKTSLIDNIILLYTDIKDINQIPVYTKTTSVLKLDFQKKLLNPEFVIDNKTFISPFIYIFDSFLNFYKANIVKKDPTFFPFESNNILLNDNSIPIPIFIETIYNGTDTTINLKSFQDITTFTVTLSLPLLSISNQSMTLDTANNLFSFVLLNSFISDSSNITLTFNNGTSNIFEYKFKNIQQVVDISEILSIKQYDKDIFASTSPVFTGSGPNTTDLSVSSSFTGNAITNYRVEIDSVTSKLIAGFAVLKSGSITSFSEAGNNLDTTITSANHGMIVGDKVLISSTSNYNGTFTVQNVTVNSFDIDIFFIIDEQTGNWQKNPTKTLATSFVHGLSNGDTIIISNSANYNGEYIIESVLTNTFVISKSFSIFETGTWESANTFKWSNDGGTSFTSTLVPITKSLQLLDNGISIQFKNLTGNLLLNTSLPVFTGTGSAILLTVTGIFTSTSVITYQIQIDSVGGLFDTFKWSKDGGKTFVATTVQITAAAQVLDNGISITFDQILNHVLNDTWVFSASPNDRWDFTISNEFIIDLPLIEKTVFTSNETFFSNLLVTTLGSILIKENRMISDEVQTRFLNSHFISSKNLKSLTLQKHNFNLVLPLKLFISLILDKNVITRNKININNRIDIINDNIVNFIFTKQTGSVISFFRTALVDIIMNDTIVTSVNIRLFDSSTSLIGSVVFNGNSGLNDIIVSGTFTGLDLINYRVEIDSTSNPNTFKWSDTGGTTFNAVNIPITLATQSLNNGVSVKFSSITGHNTRAIGSLSFVGAGSNDLSLSGLFTGSSTIDYRIIIDSIGTTDTFKWSKDKGRTFIAASIPITDTPQVLDNGVSINFTSKTGHSLASVGTKVFTGTGVDDATSGGIFTRLDLINYRVEIDGVANPNTFRWSDSAGTIYNQSGVIINSPTNQSLNNGVTISFGSNINHKLASISTAVFNIGGSSTGVDDATSGGAYIGSSVSNYRVEIDGVVSGNISGFADSLITPGVNTTVTSSSHGLLTGTVINITGSTNYNSSFTIQDVGVNTFDIPTVFITGAPETGSWENNNTFKWSNNGGTSFIASTVAIDTTAQVLENGITVTFASRFGHIVLNRWDFIGSPSDRWDFVAKPNDTWDFAATLADRWDFTATPSVEIPNADIKSIDQKELISTLTKNDLVDYSPILWNWDLNNVKIDFTLV